MTAGAKTKEQSEREVMYGVKGAEKQGKEDDKSENKEEEGKRRRRPRKRDENELIKMGGGIRVGVKQ